MNMLWFLGRQIIKAIAILTGDDANTDDDDMLDDDDIADDDDMLDDDDIADDDDLLDDDDIADDDDLLDDDDIADDDDMLDDDDIADDDDEFNNDGDVADEEVIAKEPISFMGRGDTPDSLASKIDSEERNVRAIQQRIKSGLAKGQNVYSHTLSLKNAENRLRELKESLDRLL